MRLLCVKLLIGVYALLSTTFHIASIIIAFDHWTEKCYDSKDVMSLAQWIVINAFVNIFYLVCLACVGLYAKSGDEHISRFFEKYSLMMWVSACLFFSYAIVQIFGMIELMTQYEKCMRDAKIIDIFAVTAVVNTNLFLGSLCVYMLMQSRR